MKKFLIFLCVCGLLAACNNTPQEQQKQMETPKAVQQIIEIPKAGKSEIEEPAPVKDTREYDKQLCKAISAGDLDKVREAIKNGANINNTKGWSCYESYSEGEGLIDDCSFPALSFAIVKGNLDIVKELIQQGADINKRTNCYNGEIPINGIAPLVIAMKGVPLDKKEMNKDIVKELIKAGADVNVTDWYDNTPLEFNEDEEIRQMLLKNVSKDSLIRAIYLKDADTFNELLKTADLKDKNKALAKAVQLNNIPFAKELIKEGADVNAIIYVRRYYDEGCSNGTILSIALDKKYKEMAALLKENGAKESLCAAIVSKDLERIRESVKAGEDINGRYQYIINHTDYGTSSPLLQSIWIGNLKMVKEIINLGAEVDLNKALVFACRVGNLEVAKYFIKKGADDQTRKQCLGSTRNVEIAKLLLDKGIAPKDIDSALFNASKEKAELLISRGANVNARTQSGETPLFVALGNIDTLEFLISKGAEMNVMDNCGETPLTLSIRFYREIAKFLISKGANVNYPTDFNFDKSNCKYGQPPGGTPLMTAAEKGDIEIVELLISKGADVNAKNAAGDTAWSIAAKNSWNGNSGKIIDLLKAAGAKE